MSTTFYVNEYVDGRTHDYMDQYYENGPSRKFASFMSEADARAYIKRRRNTWLHGEGTWVMRNADMKIVDVVVRV